MLWQLSVLKCRAAEGVVFKHARNAVNTVVKRSHGWCNGASDAVALSQVLRIITRTCNLSRLYPRYPEFDFGIIMIRPDIWLTYSRIILLWHRKVNVGIHPSHCQVIVMWIVCMYLPLLVLWSIQCPSYFCHTSVRWRTQSETTNDPSHTHCFFHPRVAGIWQMA